VINCGACKSGIFLEEPTAPCFDCKRAKLCEVCIGSGKSLCGNCRVARLNAEQREEALAEI